MIGTWRLLTWHLYHLNTCYEAQVRTWERQVTRSALLRGPLNLTTHVPWDPMRRDEVINRILEGHWVWGSVPASRTLSA